MANDPANRLAKGAETDAAYPQQTPGHGEDERGGLGKPKTPLLGNVLPAAPITRWKDRNDFLYVCVRLGLNARQISELSLSSPQPITTTQQVYDMIQSQGLAKLYMAKKTRDRRLGDHNRAIIEVFMKLTGQALEYGYEVTDVLRDEAPAEGMRFRTDLGERIGNRSFIVEIQRSKIEYTRWRMKLQHSLKLYRLWKRPFRSLILLDRPQDLHTVRGYARELLADRPNLNLYLFLTLDAFRRERDVLKAPVWYGARDPRERFSLL